MKVKMKFSMGIDHIYTVLLYCVIASLAGPYEESVDQGSYRDQKSVILSKNEGDYPCQYFGSPFNKKEDGELEIFYSGAFHIPTLRALSGIKPFVEMEKA